MAGPYDLWRNDYDVPGPQDPRRQDEIRSSSSPLWEEVLLGSMVSAIKQNPMAQMLERYLNRPAADPSQHYISPIDGAIQRVDIEPGVMDRLPAKVQEGLDGVLFAANFVGPGGKVRSGRRLPMDAASRDARREAMGYADEPFWRGEGAGELPDRYKRGAGFSRDNEYASGVAQRGGFDQPREFRLNLSKALKDYEPMTASQYNQLVQALAKVNPRAANDMVSMVATDPSRGTTWLNEYARRFPDQIVADSGAMARLAVEQNSPNAVKTFRDAGFDALDFGRDVLKISGDGIRLSDAAFDPKRARSQKITAALAGATVLPVYLQDPEGY